MLSMYCIFEFEEAATHLCKHKICLCFF